MKNWLGIVILSLIAVPAFSQINGLPDVGTKPFGSYSHNDFAKVDLLTGNVSGEIPLVSYPQRGKLDPLSFGLSYNTDPWVEQQMCDPTYDYCYSAFQTTGPGVQVTSSWLTEGLTIDPSMIYACYFNEGSFGWVPLCQNGTVSYTLADQSGHASTLNIDQSNIDWARSADGDGPALYSSGTYDMFTSSGISDAAIYLSNGSKYTNLNMGPSAPGTLTDSTGANSITFSLDSPSNTWRFHDSIGRIIPDLKQAFLDPASQSSAGCPDLGDSTQPVVGGVHWDPPGVPSPGYIFCFSTVSVHTGFYDSGAFDPTESTWTYPNEPQGSYTPVPWSGGTSGGTLNTIETIGVLQSVVLPNGKHWGFLYETSLPAPGYPAGATTEAYGALKKILYPTGGSTCISYAKMSRYPYINETAPLAYWAATAVKDDVGTCTDTSGSAYTYTYQTQDFTNGLYSTTEVTPDGNTTVHSFADFQNNSVSAAKNDNLHEVEADTYNGPATGTPLKTVSTCYYYQTGAGRGNPCDTAGSYNTLPLSVTTKIGTSIVSVEKMSYDPQFTPSTVTCTYDEETPDCYPPVALGPAVNYINPSRVDTYGSGGTAPIKSDLRKLKAQYSSGYLSTNQLTALEWEQTLDSSGATAALTTYGYDETGYAPAGNLGNQTSVDRWLNTGPADVITHVGYDSYGMATSQIDAKNKTTTITYDPLYGLYPYKVQAPSTSGTNHVDYYSYDHNNSHLIWHTDQNGAMPAGDSPSSTPDAAHTTTYAYDEMGRLTDVLYPPTNAGQGETRYCYTDDGGYGCTASSAPYSVYSTVVASPSNIVGSQHFDGLGRLATSVAPSGAKVDTLYNSVGLVASVSNPYFTTSDSSYGITSYTYDALGRKLLQCQPDNGSNSPCTIGSSYLQWIYSPNANVTTAYDEMHNSWQNTSDALGRLTNVVEPGGLQTNYSYDVLGNLLGVTQLGTGTDTPRSRSFTYDSLSRLKCASNPENSSTSCPTSATSTIPSGVVAYLYDPNGNVTSKTDARGITSTYGYDDLNRLSSKSYSDGFTPPVSYSYDVSSISGASNTNGQLTSETVTSGSTVISNRQPYAYDAMGRVEQLLECTPANCSGTADPYHLAYAYDLAGNLTKSTNGIPIAPFTTNPSDISPYYGNPTTGAPSSTFNGVVTPSVLLTTTYDSANRPSAITSSWADTKHPSTLFQATSTTPLAYGPVGLENAVLGYNPATAQTTVNMKRTHDNRLRLLSEVDTSSTTTTMPATGSAGNILISGAERVTVSSDTPATGTVHIVGAEGRQIVCEGHCVTVYDTGDVSVTVGSFTADAGYGMGSTSTTIASALASALNGSGTPVHATSSGAIVTITSLATGPSSDYALSVGDGDDFSGTPSGTTLTGGATGGTTYDSGSINVTINGTLFSAPWGSTDTPHSVATAMASTISGGAPGVLSASAVGGVVHVTSVGAGSSVNWSLACSTSDTAGQAPSFGTSCSGLSGGANSYTGPAVLYSYSIPTSGGFAPNGNLVNAADSVTGNWTYGYDNLNRLTQGIVNSGTYMGTNVAGTVLGWSYDSFGNRLLQTSDPTVFPSGSAQYSGSNNRATGSGLVSAPTVSTVTFGYDAAGDLTANNGTTRYVYDAEGRLCAVTNGTGGYTQYIYDAEGNRVAKGSISTLSCNLSSNGFSPTTSYVLDASGAQLTEMDVQVGGWAWDHSNAFANDGLMATYSAQGSGETYFALNDWLGTKRVEVTPDGLASSFSNMPFGDGLVSSGGTVDPNEEHFTGNERDTESGFDHFGARYYGSSIGRFVSPDPSGIAYGNSYNPQSLNLYSYVLNNPLRYIDPTGLYCAWEDGTSDDDPSDGGATEKDCNSQGGHWTNQSNPCHGADGCVSTFDWNPPQTQSVAVMTLIAGGQDMRQLMLRYLQSCEGHAPGGGYGAYNDSMGFCTTGYGQLLHRSPCTAQDIKAHQGETQQQAEGRLEQDYDQANRFIQNNAPDSTEGQRNAFVDMTFNMGTGEPGGAHGMVNHDAWRDFINGNDASVPGDIMSLSAGGRGIRTRRGNEVSMWNGGAPPAVCY